MCLDYSPGCPWETHPWPWESVLRGTCYSRVSAMAALVWSMVFMLTGFVTCHSNYYAFKNTWHTGLFSVS